MNALLAESLAIFLFWWSLLSATYCAAILTLDWLVTRSQERRQQRKELQAALDRIDGEMHSSLRRLSAEFITARDQIRRAGGR